MKLISRALMCAVFLTSMNAMAVDLSQVSNADLLNEISKRLGSGSGGGSGEASIVAMCNGGYLKITVYGTAKNGDASEYLGSDCANAQAKLQKKMGSFSGTRIFAVCSGGYLKTLKAVSTGDLTVVNSDYAGSNCQSQADSINSTLSANIKQ